MILHSFGATIPSPNAFPSHQGYMQTAPAAFALSGLEFSLKCTFCSTFQTAAAQRWERNTPQMSSAWKKKSAYISDPTDCNRNPLEMKLQSKEIILQKALLTQESKIQSGKAEMAFYAHPTASAALRGKVQSPAIRSLHHLKYLCFCCQYIQS